MKYLAYIFDFDFTLADASEGIIESINFALGKLGIEPKGSDEIRRTIGMALKEASYILMGNDDERAATRFTEYFKDKADLVITPSTVFYPDSKSVLKSLKAKNIKTAIVSNKLRHRIVEALEKHNAIDLVDCIIGFEDMGHAKPSPEGLIKAIELLNIPKDRALYVGDSLIDAQTAKNAGVDFAAVTTGTTPGCEFESYPHVLIAANLSELY